MTTINLAWTASTDDVGVTGYKVFRDGVQIGSVANTVYSDSDPTLTPSTTYIYTVSAFDAAGNNSGLSTSASVTTPPALGTVSALNITTTGIDIAWSVSEVATGQVEYGTTTAYGLLSIPETSFNYKTHVQHISGLTPGIQYHFRTHSTTQANVELYSSDYTFTTAIIVDTTPPTIPANLVATPISSSQINLTWTASTDNIAVAGYKVFRDAAQVTTVTGTSYSDTGLVALSAHSYTVSAYDTAGNNSALSTSVSATTTSAVDTTPPTVPATLTATTISSSQINLSWAASTDSVGVTGYKVFRDAVQIATVTGTTYSNTGLAASTVYAYTVSAFDAALNNSALSTPASGTTSPALSSVSALNITTTSMDINWSVSEVATGQVAYGLTTAYGSLSILEPSFNYKIHTQHISGLTAGTPYHFQAHSVTQGSVDLLSSDYTFNTAAAGVGDTIPPTIPTALVANAISSTQINLSWTASTDAVGVTGYKVFRNGVQVTTVTGTSYSDTGLTTAATYTYTVSAYDAANNNSAVSANASATTLTGQVINVRDTGATGNGTTNDTAYIQAAINQIAVGGTVLIPDGTYMINSEIGVRPKSNMTLRMTSGARLKSIGNSTNNIYGVVWIEGVSNVNVIGGTIEGDRYRHGVTTGEAGMGIAVFASHVVVDGVTSIDNWGDGFFTNYGANNVRFNNCVANNNRRQGLSVSDGTDIMIENSVFSNTAGTEPRSGIDIEPDTPGVAIRVTVRNCDIFGNYRSGLLVSTSGGGTISNILFQNNHVHDNGYGGNIEIKAGAVSAVTLIGNY